MDTTRTAAGDLAHSRAAAANPELHLEDADTLALQSIAASLVRIADHLERQHGPLPIRRGVQPSYAASDLTQLAHDEEEHA